jgi:putative sterol carrier protein
MPFSPVAVPYTLALVHLDGADTNLLHLASGDLKAGDRVRAVFKTERAGSLLDIEGFALYRESPEQETAAQPGEAVATDNGASAHDEPITGGTETPMGTVYDVNAVFQALPSRFRRELVEEDLSFYFSIDDEQWTVFVTGESCVVEPGKAIDRADCFLKTTREIFLGAINGTYSPTMTDLITGRVKTNNPFLLQKFRELFA